MVSMWNNKLKAVTFSFDDGILQDKRLIQILDKYGLKATFNINSGKDNVKWVLDFPNGPLDHITFPLIDLKDIYKNHEVAGHTLTHPLLTNCSDEEIIKQINDDNKNLTKIMGYKIAGFAYPGGHPNYNQHIIDLIKENTDIKFARTIVSSHNYDLQDNLLEFKPTIYWLEDKLEETIDDFIALKPNKPQLLYIWGHSYEADAFDLWEKFDKIFQKLSNKEDIYYGTNSEVLLSK